MTLPAGVTDLPKSAAASMGMIALRDEVVQLISLAALLGLGENAEGRHHVVVVRFGEARIGLVLDKLDGVLRVPESSIEPVPPSSSAEPETRDRRARP